MQLPRHRFENDLLGIVSIMCIVGLVAILLIVAETNPATRQLLTIVIFGLGAGGIVLFRQLRKSANSMAASEARAHYCATHDQLTLLPNKSLLMDRLQTVARSGGAALLGEPLCILCIGLDRTEEVNDVLGFDASDEALIEVVSRLAAVCGKQDVVARLAEDVFAVASPGIGIVRAEALAADLIKRLAAPYKASGDRALITFSVGISGFTPGLSDPTEILRQAQMALSKARRLGGGRLAVFERSFDRDLKSRKAMEVELRAALIDETVNMVYQPQVNAKGMIVGVEALMRWTSAPRGAISPSTFVPLAETCGLSDILGRFAIRQAFLDARAWPGLKVAINVSGTEVRSGGIVATLAELVEETGVNPRDFEVEITEGVLLAEEAAVYDTLTAVKRMGFSLSLDDFGTGYSSLSYLRRFPVDKIKIDRSFVSHLGKQPESSAIIKAIIDMADALSLDVIAEGVETGDQVNRLIQSGCNQFQGFFYSRPVEVGAINGILAQGVKLAA